MKFITYVILIITALAMITISSAQGMPSIYIGKMPYHPVGWAHDGVPWTPGWERVMDAGDTLYYYGDVQINTPSRNIVGSLYAAQSGAPWIIADEHGQVTMSGGPNALMPPNMTYLKFRWS